MYSKEQSPVFKLVFNILLVVLQIKTVCTNGLRNNAYFSWKPPSSLNLYLAHNSWFHCLLQENESAKNIWTSVHWRVGRANF